MPMALTLRAGLLNSLGPISRAWRGGSAQGVRAHLLWELSRCGQHG
jgi:hypothetical protein